ncbi:MAG: 16S rRNA (uracil(1498)-N(3))-methyltransferase [Pirellulales bacterium]
MTHRYFVEPPIREDSATLAGAEAHHLLHVMRLNTGDRVTLFDGSGAEFLASIVQRSRASVELAILSKAEVDRESRLAITLAVALPKGDRQRWLVEKAVELGISRLLPLETERGVAQPAPAALDRLRRSVIEASKQCGRNRLMEVLPPVPWAEHAVAPQADGNRWIAHFDGQPLSTFRASLRDDLSPSVEVAVGPEGGFTDGEIALAGQGQWQIVDLGRRILRVETAALLLAAVAASAK